MRPVAFLLTIFLFADCRSTDKRKSKPNDETTKHKTDTLVVQKKDSLFQADLTDSYDSLMNAFVDTATLKGKRQFIMNRFLEDNKPSPPDFDTLFDLTYDGFKDYVIGYYGQAGTGT